MLSSITVIPYTFNSVTITMGLLGGVLVSMLMFAFHVMLTGALLALLLAILLFLATHFTGVQILFFVVSMLVVGWFIWWCRNVDDKEEEEDDEVHVYRHVFVRKNS